MTRTGISFALLLLTSVACSSEDVTAPRGDLLGTYVLRTVSGNALPTLANGEFMTDFTVIADTIRLYSSGDGTEVLVSQRAGESVRRQVQSFTVSAPSAGRLDIDYGCNDVIVRSAGAQSLSSCIAPPHHRLLTTETGITIDQSAMYRTPLIFERVGGTP